MNVNELILKLEELQKQGLGEFKIQLSKYNDRPFGWEFFELSDFSYSENVVVININED